MSDQVERRLVGLLGHPTHDPYGNPIPGLDELGQPSTEPFLAGVTSLVSASATGQGEATIRRIGEPLQVDVELLRRLEEAALLPGAVVSIARDGSTIEVRAAGSDIVLDLPTELARHIFVGV